MLDDSNLSLETIDILRPKIKEVQANLISKRNYEEAIQENIRLKKIWTEIKNASNKSDQFVPSYEMVVEDIKRGFLIAGINEFRKRSTFQDAEVIVLNEYGKE